MTLKCTNCNNDKDFIEETTTHWRIGTNGDRQDKADESSGFFCAECGEELFVDTSEDQ